VAATIKLADIGKWPQKVVHQYHGGIVSTIRTSLRMHAPVLFQEAIASVKPFQPVNTGDYKRSGKVVNITDGAMFFNPTIQASIIDKGRRPGKGVSREGQEALARWVHLHGMDRAPMSKRERRHRRLMRKAGLGDKSYARMRSQSSQESRARAIAFLIARAIKRRGLPAKNVISGMREELTRRVLNDVESMIAKGPQP
jgi:hypothetical protein